MDSFDLEKRTEDFGVSIVKFCRFINKDKELKIISNQLLRSGTSIGANYREANGAPSKKDFRNKIFICKKETKESVYWLKVIERTSPRLSAEAKLLLSECSQFEKIFGKITTTLDGK